jgi:hypothetical protein
MKKSAIAAPCWPERAARRVRVAACRREGRPQGADRRSNTAFAEFKTQNDARLKQLEGKGEDPITAEQVEKINTTLGELHQRQSRTRRRSSPRRSSMAAAPN